MEPESTVLIKLLVKLLEIVHPPHKAVLFGYAWDMISQEGLSLVKNVIQTIFLTNDDTTDNTKIAQAILKAVNNLPALTVDNLMAQLSSSDQNNNLITMKPKHESIIK